MHIFGVIGHNLRNLLRFGGRQTRGQFWPYAALVAALVMAGLASVMMPEMAAAMTRMQKFALEHPDQATVSQGPGHYSVTIRGNHPELMPDMGNLIRTMAAVFAAAIALLAAAVVRRLHDRGKSGAWGLMPIPFITFASLMMPRMFAQNPPDLGLFLAIFVNNALYLASLAFLVVLLAGESMTGDNRYGPPPAV